MTTNERPPLSPKVFKFFYEMALEYYADPKNLADFDLWLAEQQKNKESEVEEP